MKRTKTTHQHSRRKPSKAATATQKNDTVVESTVREILEESNNAEGSALDQEDVYANAFVSSFSSISPLKIYCRRADEPVNTSNNPPREALKVYLLSLNCFGICRVIKLSVKFLEPHMQLSSREQREYSS